MSVIDVRGLRKEFSVRVRKTALRREKRIVSAVDGVDLQVQRGEMLGYLGPNGAGKSTTLKMLTGVLHPTSGHVAVCGFKPVPQRVKLARRIGVVFGQRSQLWWDLPLSDSFELLKHIFRVPGEEHSARLSKCENLLDLGSFMDTPVRQLSLGQRMRGELTAALLHGPEILFLDEPTIGLDVVSKQAVRGFLSELGAKGDTTMVLTTHDLADIERLCERIVVIDHGRVVHDGSIQALHQRYGSRRRVIADFAEPFTGQVDLPGVVLESCTGTRLIFAVDEVGPLAAVLTASGSLRDLSIAEPEIEDVISRLYQSEPERVG